MINPLCHICHTPADFLLEKDGFNEYLCSKCKLSFVYPEPTALWLKEKVYSYESGYQGNKQADLSIVVQEKRFVKILDFISKEKPRGKILDVGCSNGQFMYWAKHRGFEASGIEINKRTADIAKQNGFAVHQGFVETAPYDKQSFDVVYLGDVIEHVTNPRNFVSSALTFLKPGGLLLISTPNMNCWWSNTTLFFYKIYGIPWSSATPPHHLFQFSQSNLDRLVAENGLNNVHTIFTRPPSLRYELGSLHLWGKYKKDKTYKSLCFMVFSFAVYTLTYGLNMLFKPFLKKDFRMICFYRSV